MTRKTEHISELTKSVEALASRAALGTVNFKALDAEINEVARAMVLERGIHTQAPEFLKAFLEHKCALYTAHRRVIPSYFTYKISKPNER